MNVICFGDSITEAGGSPEGSRWPTVLQLKLDAWRPGAYSVYNRGVGGHTSAQGFDRWDDVIRPLLPGLVLAEFGFNDSHVRDWTVLPRVSMPEFKRNLAEMHRLAAAGGGTCVFIVNHPSGFDWQFPASGASPCQQAIREVADEVGAAIVDLPALFQERGLGPQGFLDADGVHLTAQGNHVYADLVFGRLQSLLQE